MKAKKATATKTGKMVRTFKRYSSDRTIPIFIGASRVPVNVRLNNISMGGVSFLADERLRTGTIIYIRDGSDSKPVRTKAHVVWVKEGKGGYDTGIEFSEPKYTARVRIMRSVM